MKAVLYDLIVIGEAASTVPVEIRDRTPEVPWRLMSDLRNVIAHEYFRIDPKIVWDAATVNLPALVEPLQQLVAISNK